MLVWTVESEERFDFFSFFFCTERENLQRKAKGAEMTMMSLSNFGELLNISGRDRIDGGLFGDLLNCNGYEETPHMCRIRLLQNHYIHHHAFGIYQRRAEKNGLLPSHLGPRWRPNIFFEYLKFETILLT